MEQTTKETITDLEFENLAELSKRVRTLAKDRGLNTNDLAKMFGYKNYRSMRASNPWMTKRLPIAILILSEK